MRELFGDAILPLLLVILVVFGGTALLFDIPPLPPPEPPLALTSTAGGHLGPATQPAGADERRRPVRETANEVMARAMRSLGASPGSGAEPDPIPAPSAPGEAPEVKTALGAIADAIRASREARTEADLVQAEEALREARRRMEAGCAATGGPLCKSAAELQRLGY